METQNTCCSSGQVNLFSLVGYSGMDEEVQNRPRRLRELEATGSHERRNRECVGQREVDKSSVPWREIVVHAGTLCS